VDAAAKNLYVEAREATKSMDDIAADAFMLPDRVATRSLEYDAPALLLRMLAFYVELYPTAAEVGNDRIRDRLLHLVFALPPQLGRLIEHDFQRADLPESECERATRRLEIVFRTVAELLKVIADEDPQDTARIGNVNSAWAEIFGSWRPEHDREEEWPGLSAEELARRQAHNAAIDVLVASKDELESLRDAYRFALAYWALHRLERAEDPAWAGVVKLFVPWLGSVERLGRRSRQGHRDRPRHTPLPSLAPNDRANGLGGPASVHRVRLASTRSDWPSDSSTSTPVSPCAKPVTSRPRWIGTASSPTQPARMRSMWFCHRPSP
jgi:hypothetical protein